MDAIDLFAGAGGLSTAAQMAGVTVRWAANHWQAAVDAHAENHPHTLHACEDLLKVHPAMAPTTDLILAAPACQGHTHARGKDRPHHDTARSTAGAVVTFVQFHRPAAFLVENVPAFLKWEGYPAWCADMNALGYALAPHVSDAADHGVPQNRRRAFVVGTRSRHPVVLNLPRRAHVPASSFIDFAAGTWSPICRPGRARNTLERISAGRRLFGERFLAPYYGSGSGLTGRSMDRPIGTITTRDRWAVIDGDRMRMALPVESQAAMGFPASYKLPADPRLATHLLGNSVCPLQGRDYIAALRAVL